MKFHIRYKNTDYFLCGMEAFQNGEMSRDNLCRECNSQSKDLLWGAKTIPFLEKRISWKSLDKSRSQL